jgi:hypothetical protein
MRIAGVAPYKWVQTLILVGALAACSSTPPGEPVTYEQLDEMGAAAITRLVEIQPDTRAAIDDSKGYMVIDMTMTKIPMVGSGGGLGVVVDKRDGTHSYIKVSQFEVGGGVGVRKFKVVVLFEDASLIDKVTAGNWHYDAGAEAGAGEQTAGTSAGGRAGKGYRAYRLSEGSLVVAVTVRAARARPYTY